MAIKKADLKTTSVAEAKKITDTIVTNKAAANIKPTVEADKETAPKKTAVKEAAPKKAASAKPAAKRTAKKAAEKTAPKTAKTVKTTTAAKAATTAAKTVTTAVKTATAAAKTTTASKPVSKTVSNKAELYIQFAGKDIATNDLISKVQEIWVSELGNKMSALKNLKLYMKPEEHAAYYVINDDISGRIDM